MMDLFGLPWPLAVASMATGASLMAWGTYCWAKAEKEWDRMQQDMRVVVWGFPVLVFLVALAITWAVGAIREPMIGVGPASLACFALLASWAAFGQETGRDTE